MSAFFMDKTLNRSILPDIVLPSEIYFRRNIHELLPEIAAPFGRRTVIITTSSDLNIYYEQIRQINSALNRAGTGCIIYDRLPSLPNTEDIDEAVSFTGKTGCDLVIGIGGAESLSAAKLISLMIPNYTFCSDLINGQSAANDPLNLITVPGCPLFGLEISPLLFIRDIQENGTGILYDTRLFPKAAVIDPSYALMIPARSLASAMTASMSVALESIISVNSNTITGSFALKAVDIIYNLLKNPDPELGSYVTLESFSTASVLTGFSFATSFLSISMAAAISLKPENFTAMTDAMALIIPNVLEFNISSALGKYGMPAKILAEDSRDLNITEASIKAIEAVRTFAETNKCPKKLSLLNIGQHDIRKAAADAVKMPFIKNSPKPVELKDMENLISSVW